MNLNSNMSTKFENSDISSSESSDSMPSLLPLSNVIDLTNEPDEEKTDQRDDHEQSVTQTESYISIKTEKMNHSEVVALLLTLSSIPYLIIACYTFFPMLTLIITFPWLVLIYKLHTYKYKPTIFTNDNYKRMITIVYHQCKESVYEIYQRFKIYKDI